MSDTSVVRTTEDLAMPRFPRERMRELSLMPRPTRAERAELAALCEIAIADTITAGQVWRILLDFHRIGHNITLDHEPQRTGWLDNIDRDMRTVWHSLKLQASGETVQEARQPDFGVDNHDDYSQWCDQRRAHDLSYYAEVCELLGRDLGGNCSELVSSDEIIDIMPDSIIDGIERKYHGRWYRSPYGLGAAMCTQLPYAFSRLGHDKSSPHLLDSLTQAVIWATQAYDKATSHNSEEPSQTLVRLDFAWMVLKGFVYGLVSTGMTDPLFGTLKQSPELVVRVSDALTYGQQILNNTEVPYEGRKTGAAEIDQQVGDMPVAQLVEELHRLIEATQIESVHRL